VKENWIVMGLFMWAGWSIVNTMVAGKKNISQAGVFFASVLFSPFLVFLYIIASPANQSRPAPAPVRPAPPPSKTSQWMMIVTVLVAAFILMLALAKLFAR
jgi:hypothetical protein